MEVRFLLGAPIYKLISRIYFVKDLHTDYIIPALLSLVAGMLIFFLNGFGIPFARNYGGDFLVIIFLYSCLSVIWNRPMWVRCLAVLGFAVLTEVVQYTGALRLFAMEYGAYGHLFLGTTFDWKDIVAYVVAAITVFIVEQLNSKQHTDYYNR
jgi:hypothetical protein